MEEKLILALSGVTLGWLLTTINNFYKNRTEKKKALGKIIQRLYWIHIQLVSWNQQMNLFKDQFSDFRKFEEIRKQMHSIEIFNNIGLDDNVIGQLAELNPFYAIKVKDRIEEFKMYRSSLEKYFELADLTNNEYTYYSFYWSICSTNFIFQKEIENIILKFSWSYGVRTWIRLTMIKSQTNEKSIRHYLSDYLQTIQNKSSESFDSSALLESLIKKMPISEEEKIELKKRISELNITKDESKSQK